MHEDAEDAHAHCKMIFFVKLIFPYIRLLFLGWDCVEPFEAALKLQFGAFNRLAAIEFHYMEKNRVFLKNLHFLSNEERKTWTSWMTWE